MKMKSRIFIIIIFICLILLFIYIKTRTTNYSINYEVDKYKIEESFNKNKYVFLISNNKRKYAYEFNINYISNKELINKINVYKKDKDTCILPKSDKIKFYPLCSDKNDNLYSYGLSNIKVDNFDYKKINEEKKQYKDIKINYFGDNNYLIYNYANFYYLNKDNQKEIKMFDKDVYNINLLYQLNEYILIADYNDDYYFKKFYIINMKKGMKEEFKFNFDISFDSYFLGDYKNNIYLVDKKEKKEYKINISKLKIEEVTPVILKNNELKEEDIKNIINKELYFDNIYNNYEIIDKKIYQVIDDIKIKISDLKIDNIVKIANDNVYYISDSNLYMYNYYMGEILLLQSFEWNFNRTNMIFIY